MSEFLDEAIGFLEGELGDCSNRVARADAASAGEIQAECGAKLRKLAAAHWLANQSAAEFYRHIGTAARCRVSFLKFPGALESPHYAANAVESFENALIAQGSPLGELADLALQSRHTHGHVTDWAYQWVLASVAAERDPDVLASDAWKKLAAASHSIYARQLECVRAIVAQDSSAFRAAFAQWLAERKPAALTDSKLADYGADDMQAKDFVEEAEDYVFFEGLAILRLAEHSGLARDAELVSRSGLDRLLNAAP